MSCCNSEVPRIVLGDVGTEFVFFLHEISFDFSDSELSCITEEPPLTEVASVGVTLQVIFIKPDDSALTETAVLYTDGSDGGISFTSEDPSIFDLSGSWSAYPKVITTDNKVFTGSSICFEVTERP